MPVKAPAKEPREDDLAWNDGWDEEDGDIDDRSDDGEPGNSNAGTSDDEDDDLPEPLKKQLDAHRAAIEADIVAQIAGGKTDGEIYKGLQRELAKRDKAVSDRDHLMAQMATQIQELKTGFAGVQEGISWTGNKLIDALEPEAQSAAKAELVALKQGREAAELRAAIDSLRNGGGQRPQQQDAQVDAAQAAALERRQKFVDENKALAKDMGIDPKTLDYGSDEDGVVEMQEKFRKSLMKAIADKSKSDLESVTRKRQAPSTRTDGGGSAAWSGKSSADLLEQGIAQRMPRIRDSRHRGRK